MADTDKSLYNLRYNQITSNIEGFGGGSPQWTLLTLNNVDPQQVPITRQINTTTPLQGGGNLTVDRTLSILQATNISDGYLSSVDWNTFNNKQPAGSYITALTGDGTAAGPGSVPLTLATVNGNVGTFSYASITVNAKGLITSAANGATGSLTDIGTDGIVVTGGTGAVIGSGTSIAQQVADSTHNGYLSSTDWTTFNNKQSTLTLGNLTDIGIDGITVTGGTDAVVGSGTSLSQHVADTTHNGYLSSTDWTTFNGKQAAGNYITALTGDVTATGPGSVAATLATVNSNVGSFTNASITVNGKGLITAASSGAATGTVTSGTANKVAYYPASTASVSSTAGATVNAAGYIIGTTIQLNVNASTSTVTSSSSITFVAVTNLTQTITPLSSTSVIRITVQLAAAIVATVGSAADMDIRLVRNPAGTPVTVDTYNEVFGYNSAPAFEGYITTTLTWYDSPATTSSTVYAVQIRNSTGGTASVNLANIAAPSSYIRIDEIAQ